MANKPLVVYHEGCADGIGAAWCFWKQFGDTMDYHPGVYNMAPPDVFDRDVYMVDFSYNPNVMVEICKYANHVILLDHHQTALEGLWHLVAEHSNFNMDYATLEKSGSMIAWDYVKQTTGHNRKLPAIIAHIQDRDMWKFKLPNTREIMDAVFSYPKTFEAYDALMKLSKNSLKGLIKEGMVIRRKFLLDLESIADQCKRMMTIGGVEVPVANANGMYASELGNFLSEGQPFAATYYDTEKFRVFSLRSVPGGMDVSVVAMGYGGGGHKHAAGFKVERIHILAIV